ncbi:hypothetical protein [Protofrankia symbiont of Coriaria ruscifolia]|uniref:hypothetical protein n=1 Tax=Protofrankia symbiont of Coriaria ruscifolia TaxID=1306542 RepID=UPI001A945898|nr:hypothetical protein [Protofrankia symbiont of Coriaria ruscifolia]
MTAPDRSSHAPAAAGGAAPAGLAAPGGGAVPVFRRGEWYDSLDSAPLPGGGGWRLSLVPRALVAADARRSRTTSGPRPDHAQRLRILRHALDLFDQGALPIGSLGNQEAAGFRAAMTSVAGLPEPLTEQWITLLRVTTGPDATPGGRGSRRHRRRPDRRGDALRHRHRLRLPPPGSSGVRLPELGRRGRQHSSTHPAGRTPA